MQSQADFSRTCAHKSELATECNMLHICSIFVELTFEIVYALQHMSPLRAQAPHTTTPGNVLAELLQGMPGRNLFVYVRVLWYLFFSPHLSPLPLSL